MWRVKREWFCKVAVNFIKRFCELQEAVSMLHGSFMTCDQHPVFAIYDAHVRRTLQLHSILIYVVICTFYVGVDFFNLVT